MSHYPTLVLFTGLAADERLLDPQRELPCTVITHPWLEPEENETLPHYARRVAESREWPAGCVLGGVSFGGMLAAEMSLLLRPRGVVLIASCLSSKAVPALYRFVNTLCRVVPDPALRMGTIVSRPVVNFFRSIGEKDSDVMMDMMKTTPVPRLRRTTDMVLGWEGLAELPCPRVWIHGENDLVIPLKKLSPHKPEVVVPGAGHLVNWTHRKETNEAILRFLEGVRA